MLRICYAGMAQTISKGYALDSRLVATQQTYFSKAQPHVLNVILHTPFDSSSLTFADDSKEIDLMFGEPFITSTDKATFEAAQYRIYSVRTPYSLNQFQMH